jgi:transposase
MLADEVDYVVGVDTHRDQHVLAVVASPTGAVVAQRSIATSGRGYAQALRIAQDYAAGERVWAVEGAGHYGAGLARYLSSHGEITGHEAKTVTPNASDASHSRFCMCTSSGSSS